MLRVHLLSVPRMSQLLLDTKQQENVLLKNMALSCYSISIGHFVHAT
jgi:hypothetical protein